MKRKSSRPRKMRVTKRMIAAWEAAEQFSALSFDPAPEEFGPDFGVEYVSPFFVPAEGGGEGDEPGGADDDAEEEGGVEQDEEQPQERILFSHFSKKSGDKVDYQRTFSSVRDYCAQPFANPENEKLFNREEFVDGQWRVWEKGKKLRDHHDSPSDEQEARRKNLSWFGAETAQEAADRAFKGWPEGADKIRSMMNDVEAPPPVSLRRKMNRGDQGDELDIHSVYRGDLDHAWMRRRRTHSRSRMSVRIVAPMGGGHLMEGEQMFWRGAAVAKLAEVLEESGYRVEIVGVNQHFIDGHTTTMHCNFIVKDAAAPLDLEQVAGVVANPGFFRTWGFRDAYATCEHTLPDTVVIPEQRAVRVGRRVEWRNTGRVNRRTLLARSYFRNDNPVVEGKLDADGTKTFCVPTSISHVDTATKWVNKCLSELGH